MTRLEINEDHSGSRVEVRQVGGQAESGGGVVRTSTGSFNSLCEKQRGWSELGSWEGDLGGKSIATVFAN